MPRSLAPLLTTLASLILPITCTTLPIVPHDMYSSSVGVLGCKIDTNRYASWPEPISCDDICVRLTHAGRSLTLLRIDQSGGDYNIAYDAYNYLVTGESATVNPIYGGAVDMEFENVPAEECVQHLREGGLALSAPTSMNFVAECLAQPGSWVARNYLLFNIYDPVCHWGYDELCSLDLAVSNQPSCPHTLGTTNGRLPDTVFNVEYGTGKVVPAL